MKSHNKRGKLYGVGTEKTLMRISRLEKELEARKKALRDLQSELKKYRVFLKSTPARIVNIDLNGKILYVNHISSLKVKDVVGTPMYAYLENSEKTKLKNTLKTVLRSGKKGRLESLFLSSKGKKHIFDNHLIPIKKNGQVIEIIIIASDITERRKTEEALQKAHNALEHRVSERTAELLKANEQMRQEIEERKWAQKALKEREETLRSILDSSPDAIAVTDTEGKIIECNQKNVEMLDYGSKEELIGMRALDLISPPERNKAFANLEKTLENGIVKNVEYSLVKKDGTEFPGELSAAIVQDAAGKMAGYVAVVKDITVRKMAQEALIQSEAELREQKLALEQKNIALREIIAQIEIEKRKMEDEITANVNLVLAPVLEKLHASGASAAYVDLINHYLKSLTSSFGRKIMDKTANLTPREIEISGMIKGGMPSKEIAKLLNISRQTVERHRKNIRRKLGIGGKRVNLTSYLLKLE